MMVKVLFVCLGNICRSPMAEGVFQHLVNEAGLSEQIMVDSAGTSSYHIGETAHSGTRHVLAQHDIPYNGRARTISSQDFAIFDYILAMDEDNLASLRSKLPKDNQPVTKLFLDYADGIQEREVPDPYYKGNFEHVYQLVEVGAKGLLQAIRAEHNL